MTNKEQFESEMNALANSINEKAGSTGAKTISQLKTAVDSIVTGGTEVIANPTLVGTEDNLTGLQVADTKYALKYLALAGGTMTGNIKLNNNAAKIVDNTNLRVIEANNSSLYIGDTTSDVAVFTGNWDVRHVKNNASYNILDASNTSANPGNTTASLTSLKLNGTNYAIAGGTQVTFVDWS